jgi:mono/diheme cytochrome c family protein
MTSLHDLLLPLPLPQELARTLFFGLFFIHLLFVLLMLGTAILALAYFLEALWNNRLRELRWDKKILRIFLMHKSLAVVFGVGPLLLIQVAFSIPFFSAVVLFSPFWLLIIAFLIIAFLSFDSLGHRIETHRYVHLFFGILAMISLLCVPGFFAAVLVAAENSDKWMDILRTGFGFDWRISVHWLMRYLHILGASIVFAAAFHYFFTSSKYGIGHRPALIKWMLGGLLFQFIIGFALYLSLLHKPDALSIFYMAAGIVLALIMIWLSALALQPNTSLNFIVVLPLLLFLLASMLLTRQRFQDRAFAGIIPLVSKNAELYQKKLEVYNQDAINHYKSRMKIIYDSGPVIYAQSCGFCHGSDAAGNGPDASQLKIPPEALSEIRADKGYLMKMLDEGIDGTAMPSFDYFDKYQRESVLTYLNSQYDIFSSPPAAVRNYNTDQFQQAEKIWSNTCASCHGQNGSGSENAAKYKPPPPDFTQYSLTPQRAYRIITNGYPGTAMTSYSQLQESLRHSLVEIVLEKYRGGNISSTK